MDKGVLDTLGAKYKIGRLAEAAAPVTRLTVPAGLSGNTSHLLPAERAKATFDVKLMTEALYGGPDAVAKRRFILHPSSAVRCNSPRTRARAAV